MIKMPIKLNGHYENEKVCLFLTEKYTEFYFTNLSKSRLEIIEDDKFIKEYNHTQLYRETAVQDR